MDEADVSQIRMEREQEIRRKAMVFTEPEKGNGICQWCGEPVNHDGRWCDADCRTDFEKRNKATPTPTRRKP